MAAFAIAPPSVQFVPEYAVSINGTPIPKSLKASITGITFQNGLNAADRVEIALANPGLEWLQSHINGLGFLPYPTNVRIGPIQTPNFNGNGLFDMGNKVALSIGYADQTLSDVFEGEITGILISMTPNEMPMMTIVAHNYLNRLAQGTYGRGFGPLPDVLIAAILSAENLLLPLIDPTIAAASTALAVVTFIFNGSGRKQKAQSDLQLMKEIANAWDADFWVDGSTFYLSRFLKEYTPSVRLTWGESLLAFSPKISTVGNVFAVGVKFVLREIPLSFLVTVSWNLDTQSLAVNVIPNGSAAYAKSLTGPLISFITHPISSPPDIINSALFITRKLRNTLNNRLTANVSAVGNPNIRANAVIELNGIGPDFSGNYRITSAHHVIDSAGYRTDFKVRKEILP